MREIKKLLLVDDDPNDVELTIAALTDNNIVNDILVARDGAEALDYLKKRNKYENNKDPLPVVVLLDLKMPKIDGLEVLEFMKSDKKLKTVPVVILSSSRESKDLKRCYELGVNAYVVKPVKFENFIESVKNIGIFWVMINEPGVEQGDGQNDE